MEEASYGLVIGFEMSSFVVTRQPAVTITLLDTPGIFDILAMLLNKIILCSSLFKTDSHLVFWLEFKFSTFADCSPEKLK